jgi:uncharacterized membrane protein
VFSLSQTGVAHVAFGLLALTLGGMVVAMPKGTRRHRRVGGAYFTAMLLLNGTGLFMHRFNGGFGPFHVFVAISLATLAAGFIPVYLRRPGHAWMTTHAIFMAWSYVGLVAALAAEIAVRLPGASLAPSVFVPTVVIMIVGGILIFTQVPRIIHRMTRGRPVPLALPAALTHTFDTHEAIFDSDAQRRSAALGVPDLPRRVERDRGGAAGGPRLHERRRAGDTGRLSLLDVPHVEHQHGLSVGRHAAREHADDVRQRVRQPGGVPVVHDDRHVA